jgi:hypothetical protein
VLRGVVPRYKVKAKLGKAEAGKGGYNEVFILKAFPEDEIAEYKQGRI